MRLTTILPLALAGAALAAPSGSVQKRDKAALSTAFSTVKAAADALDTAIKAIPAATDQGAALQAILPLAEKSTAVVTALHSQAAALNATEAVGILDALSLVSASSALVKSVQTAIDDLITKKDVIQLAGATELVHTQVQQQKDAAQPFLDTVTSKLPTLGQLIAGVQGKQTIAALDKGLNAFPAKGPAAESTASPGATGSQVDGGAAGTNPVTGVSSSTGSTGATDASAPSISSSTTTTSPASDSGSSSSSGSSAPAAGGAAVSSSTDTSSAAAAPAAPAAGAASFSTDSSAVAAAPAAPDAPAAAPAAPAAGGAYGADGQSYPSPETAPSAPSAPSDSSSSTTYSPAGGDVPPPASQSYAPVIQSPGNAAGKVALSGVAAAVPLIVALMALV